ncbi:MAG: hypothetical protein AAGI44_08565 [Pseudomonadota bacterium]
MSKYMNVCLTENFEKDGKEQTNFTKVGVAFPHEKGNGFNIQIKPGLSVSGDLVVLEPKPKSSS